MSCKEVLCGCGCALLWGLVIRGPVRGLAWGAGLGAEAAAGGGWEDGCANPSTFETTGGGGGTGCDDLSRFEATLRI